MGKDLKFLIVDDFQVVRLVVRNVLKDLGHTNVEEAPNGRVALQKLEQAYAEKVPFDMVFCDWNMPELSGLQLVQFCRQKKEFSSLPIVLITAEGDSSSIVKAMQAGASDYLLKPIAPHMLQQCLKKLIGNAA